MPEITAKSFLNVLNQSGIVSQEELKPALSELSKKAAGSTVKLDELVDHLVDTGLITHWHADKLKAGKSRGYFLGKYKLLSHLGTGGMSTVYLAQNTIFNQLRAIKVLPRKRIADKSYLERFYREGRAAASLNHKNVVRVYDIDNDEDTHYLVMEYVEGKDLYEIVKADGPLPIDNVVDYTIQTLAGLKHAHENKVVHRDIKPANLLVAPGGVIKILDLGLALLREDDASLTVMHNEKVLGTADYLSPEQAVDSHTVDHRADFYSLGCTIYFLLTGQPPFPEGTMAQRIARHQSQKPKSIQELRTDCPPALVQICNRMMEKKPENRFQSCDELISVFQSLRQNMEQAPPIAAKPNAPPSSQPKVTPKQQPRKSPSSKAQAKVPVQTSPAAKSPASPPAPGSPPSGSGKAPAPAKSSEPAAAPSRGPSKQPASSPSTQPKQQQQPVAKPQSQPQKPAAKSQPQQAVAPVRIATPGTSEAAASNVGVTELRDFTKRNPSKNTTRKLRNTSIKNQVIMISLVVGMILILGIVMVVAIKLSSGGDSDESRKRELPKNYGEIVRLTEQSSTNLTGPSPRIG